MPSSPIAKEITLPDNWVQLQKTMIPDRITSSYWSVWYDSEKEEDIGDGWVSEYVTVGKAWLMWCPFGDDPSVNDSWGHVEDLSGDVKNVVTAIEAIYGVSFHDSIWFPMTSTEVPVGTIQKRITGK